MRLIVSLFIIITFLCFFSCHPSEKVKEPKASTKEQQLKNNLDLLKQIAANGDLIVRLSDDIVSQQVTQLNEEDKSYSHAGIIAGNNGKKFVYHIAPNISGADTIEIIPIDSFLNPEKNIRCALYRYDITKAEQDTLIELIKNYKKADTRFDVTYNLQTDDKLYCSEMIYKALKQATHNRIVLREHTVPERFQRMLVAYFKKQGATKELVANRKYIPLDHLYLQPGCKEIMKFNLKIFPGQ
jgi:hypothetical protein